MREEVKTAPQLAEVKDYTNVIYDEDLPQEYPLSDLQNNAFINTYKDIGIDLTQEELGKLNSAYGSDMEQFFYDFNKNRKQVVLDQDDVNFTLNQHDLPVRKIQEFSPEIAVDIQDTEQLFNAIETNEKDAEYLKNVSEGKSVGVAGDKFDVTQSVLQNEQSKQRVAEEKEALKTRRDEKVKNFKPEVYHFGSFVETNGKTNGDVQEVAKRSEIQANNHVENIKSKKEYLLNNTSDRVKDLFGFVGNGDISRGQVDISKKKMEDGSTSVTLTNKSTGKTATKILKEEDLNTFSDLVSTQDILERQKALNNRTVFANRNFLSQQSRIIKQAKDEGRDPKEELLSLYKLNGRSTLPVVNYKEGRSNWVGTSMYNTRKRIANSVGLIFTPPSNKEGQVNYDNVFQEQYKEFLDEDIDENAKQILYGTTKSKYSGSPLESRVKVDGFTFTLDDDGEIVGARKKDGSEIYNWSPEMLEAAKKFDNNKSDYKNETYTQFRAGALGATVTQTLVDMAPLMGAMVVSGGIAGAAGAGAVGLTAATTAGSVAGSFALMYGDLYEEQFNKTGDKKSAAIYATSVSTLTGLLEGALGVEAIAARSLQSRMLKNAVKKVSEKQAARGILNSQDLLSSFYKHAKKTVPMETMEEISQSFGEAGVQMMMNGEHDLTTKELMEIMLVTPFATIPFAGITSIASMKKQDLDYWEVAAANTDAFKREGQKWVNGAVNEKQKEVRQKEFDEKSKIVGTLKHHLDYVTSIEEDMGVQMTEESRNKLRSFAVREASLRGKLEGLEPDSKQAKSIQTQLNTLEKNERHFFLNGIEDVRNKVQKEEERARKLEEQKEDRNLNILADEKEVSKPTLLSKKAFQEQNKETTESKVGDNTVTSAIDLEGNTISIVENKKGETVAEYKAYEDTVVDGALEMTSNVDEKSQKQGITSKVYQSEANGKGKPILPASLTRDYSGDKRSSFSEASNKLWRSMQRKGTAKEVEVTTQSGETVRTLAVLPENFKSTENIKLLEDITPEVTNVASKKFFPKGTVEVDLGGKNLAIYEEDNKKSSYKITKINRNSKGILTSVDVVDANGKKKKIKSPALISEIEVQQFIWHNQNILNETTEQEFDETASEVDAREAGAIPTKGTTKDPQKVGRKQTNLDRVERQRKVLNKRKKDLMKRLEEIRRDIDKRYNKDPYYSKKTNLMPRFIKALYSTKSPAGIFRDAFKHPIGSRLRVVIPEEITYEAQQLLKEVDQINKINNYKKFQLRVENAKALDEGGKALEDTGLAEEAYEAEMIAEEKSETTSEEGAKNLLKRFSNQVPKALLEAQAKKVISSLSKIAPNLKIKILDPEKYSKKFSQTEGGRYVPKQNTVYINAGRANIRTVFHEATHAIIFKTIGANDPSANKKLVTIHQSIEAVLRTGTKEERRIARRLSHFVELYGEGGEVEQVKSHEFIAELVGILASEKKAISKPTTLNKIVNAINEAIYNLVGIRPLAANNIDSVHEVINYLNGLAQSLEQGQVIEADIENILADSGVSFQQKHLNNLNSEVDRIKSIISTYSDGVTLNLDGSTYLGKGVVVPITSVNTTQDKLSIESIVNFLKNTLGDVINPNLKVGLYKFEFSDQVSIDLNVIVPKENTDVALEYSKAAGQKSIFHLDVFQEEFSGADGKNPLHFSPKEIKQIAEDLLNNKLPDIDGLSFSQRGIPTEITESPVHILNAFDFADESSLPNNLSFKEQLQDKFKNQVLPKLKKLYGAKLDPTKRDALTKKYMIDAVTSESIVAISAFEDAIGWYDSKLKEAFRVLEITHPEMKTDTDLKNSFRIALAVTSNGIKVNKNFELAEEQYAHFKETGRFLEQGSGNQGDAIKKSFILLNSILDSGISMPQLITFMTKKMKAGDLKITKKQKSDLGLPSEVNLATGELVDTEVFGASILGPKIGNGFFMNLFGEYGQLTMDRWFMRTWGRLSGQLIVRNQKTISDNINRVNKAIKSIERSKKNTEVLKSLIPNYKELDAKEIANIVEELTTDIPTRKKLNSTKPLEELRKAGNTTAKNVRGEVEAPRGGRERKFIREVFSEVQEKLLNEHGIAIEMADLQAAIWYPEKVLYESFQKGRSSEVQSELFKGDGAPDYANAAEKLAKSKNIDNEKIKQARKSDTGRLERPATTDGRGSEGIGTVDSGVDTEQQRIASTRKNILEIKSRKRPIKIVEEFQEANTLNNDIQFSQLSPNKDVTEVKTKPGVFKMRVGNSSVFFTDRKNPITDEHTGEIELELITTDSGKTGRGSARKVIQKFLDYTDSLGKTVHLTVNPRDKQTKFEKLQDFYRSVGFREGDYDFEMVRGAKRGDIYFTQVNDFELAGKTIDVHNQHVNGQRTGDVFLSGRVKRITEKAVLIGEKWLAKSGLYKDHNGHVFYQHAIPSRTAQVARLLHLSYPDLTLAKKTELLNQAGFDITENELANTAIDIKPNTSIVGVVDARQLVKNTLQYIPNMDATDMTSFMNSKGFTVTESDVEILMDAVRGDNNFFNNPDTIKWIKQRHDQLTANGNMTNDQALVAISFELDYPNVNTLRDVLAANTDPAIQGARGVVGEVNNVVNTITTNLPDWLIKFKKFFSKYFLTTKGLPKEFTAILSASMSNLKAEIRNGTNLSTDLKVLIKKYQLSPKDQRNLRKMLEGGSSSLLDLDKVNSEDKFKAIAAIEGVIKDMNDNRSTLIGTLSAELRGLLADSHVDFIEHNGTYVTRVYKRFTTNNWNKKNIQNLTDTDGANIGNGIWDNAREFFKDHLREEVNRLRDKLAQNPTDRQNIQAEIDTAEDYLRNDTTMDEYLEKQLIDDEASVLIKKKYIGSSEKNLKRREDIPDVLLKFWGEIEDAPSSYEHTVMTIAKLVTDIETRKMLREVGLNEGFLSTKGGPGLDLVVMRKKDGNSVKDKALLGSHDAIYAAPEVVEAFEEVQDMQDRFLKFFVKINGWVKGSLTIYDPTVQLRNFVGNTPLVFAGGGNPFDISGTHRLANEHLEAPTGRWAGRQLKNMGFNKLSGKVSHGPKALVNKRMHKLGVLGQSVGINEFEFQLSGGIANSVETSSTKKGKNLFGKIAKDNVARRFYEFGDDYWKAQMFFTVANKYAKQKYGMTWEQLENSINSAKYDENNRPRNLNVQDQSRLETLEKHREKAEAVAAYEVRQGLPNYGEILGFAEFLKKSPILGSFVSFTAELIRITGVNLVRGYKGINNNLDLDSMENPYDKSDKDFVKKTVVGNSVKLLGVLAMTYALPVIISSMNGVDDEDRDNWGNLLPPWEKNPIYLGLDKHGNMRYVSWTSVNPYTYVTDALAIMTKEGGVKSKALSTLRHATDPFIGTEIGSGFLIDIYKNTDPNTGRPISYAEGDPGVKAWEYSKYFADNAAFPGVRRLITNLQNNDPDKPWKSEDQLKTIISGGSRFTRIRPEVSGKYSLRDVAIGAPRSNSNVYKSYKANNKEINDDVQKAVNDASKYYYRALEESIPIVKALKEAGLSRKEIKKLLQQAAPKGTKYSPWKKAEINYILSEGKRERPVYRWKIPGKKKYIKSEK